MDNIWVVKSMKWSVFFVVMLIFLLPQPLFFSYTQPLDGRSLRLVESTIIHEGDLVIEGTQTFVIENCTYYQTGNIYAQDHGRLVIRNSVLVFKQTLGHEFSFGVNNQATLEIENSELMSTPDTEAIRITVGDSGLAYIKGLSIVGRKGRWGSVYFYGDSHGYIMDSSVWQLIIDGNADVECSNSTIDYEISLCLHSPYTFDINGLEPGRYIYWDLQENETTTANCELLFKNTLVTSWSLIVERDCIATISNSTFNTFSFDLIDTFAQIENIKNSTTDWNFGSVTITNSHVSSWHFTFSDNISAVVKNSDITVACSWNSNPKSVIAISNSRIGLHFWHYRGAIFSNQTTCWMIDTIYTDVFLDGNLSFEYGNLPSYLLQPTFPTNWISSNITRNYNIAVDDTDGNSVANVELTLLDRNDTAVWNGTADNLGKADFNLTFTDNIQQVLYTGTFQLDASKEGFYPSPLYLVGFLTDTPIQITLTEKPVGDLNEDRTVNIVDISIVAVAFGCKPGDENWNVIADVAEPYGEINIVDISIVAVDFGKTL